ncbi:E1-E2 ATPase-domain-containing protein [Mycena polygramma]|nr:E1-E2 ATPase-domain-containing protein [Mycena polygramma]
MPSDEHNIPSIITTDFNADDDRGLPSLATSPVQNLCGGLLAPHSLAVKTRGSLDVPSSPTHTADGASIITVPPSPTLSSRSSVHFSPTSLALRDNNPQLRNPSLLLPPRDESHSHQRKGSNATFATTTSDTTEADQSPQREQELRHVKSNTTSVTTRVGSHSASRAKRDMADSDAATTITDWKQAADLQEDADLDSDLDSSTDPTPFRFRSNDLAMMLDAKSLETLEYMGGIDGLLDGLGTASDVGLGGASLARVEAGLSSPGAGVGVSHRHDPEKGNEPVPAITLADPEGEKSANWDSRAAFAASLDIRRHIYGKNVLPRRATKSLLSLMYTALKDKVLVLLSIAAVVSLALGSFQDFGTPRPANEPRVDWVEGVAIMVAILIVVMVGSVNDWQKERQFQTLNDKKEEHAVKVIRGGIETVVDIKQVVVGEIALLDPGEIVPCDGVFISGHNVKCDESGATEESDAVKKVSYDDCITLRGTDGGAHTDCFVISGSKVLEGVSKYVVVAVGTKSFNGRIMMALRGDADDTPLPIKLNALAELIAKFGSAAGLILFIALLIRFFVQLGQGEPVRYDIPSSVSLRSGPKLQNGQRIMLFSYTHGL